MKMAQNVGLVMAYNIKPTAIESEHFKASAQGTIVTIHYIRVTFKFKSHVTRPRKNVSEI